MFIFFIRLKAGLLNYSDFERCGLDSLQFKIPSMYQSIYLDWGLQNNGNSAFKTISAWISIS